jgi:hypothetical protein
LPQPRGQLQTLARGSVDERLLLISRDAHGQDATFRSYVKLHALVGTKTTSSREPA